MDRPPRRIATLDSTYGERLHGSVASESYRDGNIEEDDSVGAGNTEGAGNEEKDLLSLTDTHRIYYAGGESCCAS